MSLERFFQLMKIQSHIDKLTQENIELVEKTKRLLEENNRLTEEVRRLTEKLKKISNGCDHSYFLLDTRRRSDGTIEDTFCCQWCKCKMSKIR
jgi:regulator of replication initiation timing